MTQKAYLEIKCHVSDRTEVPPERTVTVYFQPNNISLAYNRGQEEIII